MNEDIRREQAWLLKEKYNGAESDAYRADLKRLADGEPLAYVIGHIPFLDATVSLTSRPLIPRTETEYWVERAIEELKSTKREMRILDLCAGSGCIGVSVLKALPMARVDFCEINGRHHPTIAKNILDNGTDSSRTHIYGGDLFSDIPADAQYDMILSNPPYIDPARSKYTEESVLTHEPHEALFGGVRGIELIERILIEAPAYLISSGILYIEHEPEQRDEIHRIGATLPYVSCTTQSDQYGIARYTRLVRTERN